MDDECKVGGRSFQTRGPETAKLRDPYTSSFSFWAPSYLHMLKRLLLTHVVAVNAFKYKHVKNGTKIVFRL